MFDEQMINGDLLYMEAHDVPSVRMKVRLPWYRSLPLSCVERLEVDIDGERAAGDALSLSLYGQTYTLGEAAGRHTVGWFVLDTADLHVRTRDGLAPGTHRVDLTMNLRIPYGDPDFKPLEFTQVARCSRELTLVGRDD